ncbi:MAG: triose-phosphate isomerase [Bacteroidales bacterium]|nr:triose-phosphate isomerase [Bacteroidales bacterium]MBO7141512.1 triose-phosphate isomerase [Bacteroidales bacterium]
MRKLIVAGNWKMNTSVAEGVELAKKVSEYAVSKNLPAQKQVVIAPPFTHLAPIAQVINADKVILAAQDCAATTNGAYTGEVSASMLKGLGVKAVILGHSERRQYFKENSEILLKKIKLALAEGLDIIFCIGETKEQREAGANLYNNVIKAQLVDTVFTLTPEEFKKVIIAYEPVWAIGTGLTATPEQAQDIHAMIRKAIADNFGQAVADDTTILYGGSCKPSNAAEIFAKKDVDGGLIGGASLKADDFAKLIDAR